MSQNPAQASHFKNYLAFYVVTVATVLGLFQFTAAYGEAHLKAPLNLNGRYSSESAPAGCPASQFAIIIQQSGIYLNGAIELAQPAAQPAAKPTQPAQFTLIGRWQQGKQQVNLAGPGPALAICSAMATAPTVDLQATFQPPAPSPAAEAALVGQITLNSAQPWSFTAVRQVASAQQSAH